MISPHGEVGIASEEEAIKRATKWYALESVVITPPLIDSGWGWYLKQI